MNKELLQFNSHFSEIFEKQSFVFLSDVEAEAEVEAVEVDLFYWKRKQKQKQKNLLLLLPGQNIGMLEINITFIAFHKISL